MVQPGPGGCSLFFPWKTVPSSQSWPWPPSRIASLPSEESSSLSLARGHGDGGAAWKNRSGIYAVQKRVRSFVGSLLDWFTLYVFTRSFSPASVYSQMLIPVSRSPPERLSVLLSIRWVTALAWRCSCFLSLSSISQPASLLMSEPDHNTLLNQWSLMWRSQSCRRKNQSSWVGMLSLWSTWALFMKEQKPVLT